MGQIREELMLSDGFSASFAKFLQLGDSAVSKMGQVGLANVKAASATERASKKIEATQGSLAASRQVLAAQNALLSAQTQKVVDLHAAYEELANQYGENNAKVLAAAAATAKAQVAEARLVEQKLRTTASIEKMTLDIAQQTAELKRQQTVAAGHENVVQKIAKRMGFVKSQTKAATDQQKQLKQATDSTADSAGKLVSAAKRVAAAIAGISITKGAIGLSDELAQTEARLNLMNDGQQTTAQLQNLIYSAAQRSRVEYTAMADVVAKIGQRASDAFDSSAEVLQFAENLNKQFIIAGASQEEIASASLQLTQALGSGVLRGEEFNAVFESAPNIIKTVADYLGVPVGKMRDMASEGQISASIVKNAMLSATNDINAEFAKIPMTYQQAATKVKNAGVKAFESIGKRMNEFLNSDKGERAINALVGSFEILASVGSGAIDLLTSGASFVIDNWDYVYPVIMGVAAAFGVAGMAGMASGIATVAAWGPVAWTAIAIGAGIAALVFVLKQAGVSWQEMGAVAGEVLGWLYTLVYNAVSWWYNLFAAFAQFFASFLDNPASAIAHLVHDLFDNILNTVQTVASAIDAVFGSNLSGAVAGFRGKLSALVDKKFGAEAVQIKTMAALDVPETLDKFSGALSGLGQKMDDFSFSLGEIEGIGGAGSSTLGKAFDGNLGNVGKVGSVGKVKGVEGEIKLSDEDLKLYRDLAERRYMTNIELKTLAPNINVTMPEGMKNADPKAVADYIKKMLMEQMNASAKVAHG